jgi:hypothetical protein
LLHGTPRGLLWGLDGGWRENSFCGGDFFANSSPATRKDAHVLTQSRRLWAVGRLDASAESRSLSASRARQTAAGKNRRGTAIGMTRGFLGGCASGSENSLRLGEFGVGGVGEFGEVAVADAF